MTVSYFKYSSEDEEGRLGIFRETEFILLNEKLRIESMHHNIKKRPKNLRNFGIFS